MKTTFTKAEFVRFVNELSVRNRHRKVTEEPIDKGFFTSQDLSTKYKICHRIVQRMLSELLLEERLKVVYARRKVSKTTIRKVPCYKFKFKSDEKSFKGYSKRQR